MAKKEIKTEKIEREYVIPLREKGRVVPRYKKTPKAIKTIKEFLVRHMKIRDRDLNKIKIDKYLNEVLWRRGIKKPPHKIKVKAIKEGEIVKVEAIELPNKLKFKKAREMKIEEETKEIKNKKKKLAEKAKEAIKPEQEKTEEEKKEEKEKTKAGAETSEKMKKAAAKTAKHQTITKAKQPKRQQRKSLAK